MVAKLSSVDMISGYDPLQGRLNHFDRRGGKDVKVEMIAVDPVSENLVQERNVVFHPDAFPDFIKVLSANSRAKYRIMEQQVSQFSTLLDQVESGHPGRFAFKFFRRNPKQFAENITGVIEAQCLVEVAG